MIKWIAVLAIPFLFAAKPGDSPLSVIHTRHYDIHTDMDLSLVDDLSSRMDAMYDQYQKTFSDFQPRGEQGPLPVYLFETHEKYMAFTDYAGVNTGGLFVAGRRSYLAAYEQGQGRDSLRRTLQHEAFHQFAHSAISRYLPPLMNEGMAQLFEESIWIGKDFSTGQVPPRRLRQLHADILQKRLVDFDQFLHLSTGDWRNVLHTNRDKASIYYNQAWAMAYFCSGDGDPDYHTKFDRALHLLHDGNQDPDQTARECFSDTKDFRRRFNIWAAKLQATPQATMLERQETLADFLDAVTQHNHPLPADMTAFRNLVVRYNLKIQYTRNGVSYTTAESPVIYFSDLDGTVYTPAELFFKSDSDAPLPDIICQPAGSTVRYRTRFYLSAEKTEHEMLIEQVTEK